MGKDVLVEQLDAEVADTNGPALQTPEDATENGASETLARSGSLSATGQTQTQLADASTQLGKLKQYSRSALLAFRDKPELTHIPQGWDVQQFSELHKPFVVKEGQGPPPGFGPVANGSEYDGQLRKDSWRGKPSNGRGGPIRSRLVHEGSLSNADAKQAGLQQQDYAEQPAGAAGPARPARVGGRRDHDAPDWWGNGDTWRGATTGSGRGRGANPTAPPGPGERQWMGRGAPTAAGPVEIPAGAPGKTPDREAATPRSLEADWRSGKKDGPVASPSSWDWGTNHRHQASDRDLKRPPGFPDPHERQRASSRNPEWMAESTNAAKDDADGLTAGARRAKDFEAERQRMKEEWKREQAKHLSTKHVQGNEHMSNAVLQQLKDESNDAETAAAQPKSSTSEQPQPPPGLPQPSAQRSTSVSNLPDTSSQDLQRSTDDGASASEASAAQAFSFNSLAQAAGLGLRPMPMGVATLEEIEKDQSGNLDTTAQRGITSTHVDSHADVPGSHTQTASAEAPHAAAAETPAMPSPFAAFAGTQPQQQAEEIASRKLPETSNGPPAATATPPPGFAVNKAPSAFSWGSCNHLQGIWGAPTTTPSVTGQPDWGPPVSAQSGSFSTANGCPASGSSAIDGQPANQPLLPQQQLRQQQLHHEAAAAAGTPQLDQRLLFSSHQQQRPFTNNLAAPLSGQLEQLSRAQQAQQALAALANRDTIAAHIPHQGVNRAVDAAQNPLLALLGRHNAPATTGHRGSQDAQLQAFLQAQTSHYSWHPPTPAPAQQGRPAMVQPRATYLPQQAAPAANAALSQDLLRQLQLGQNVRHNAAAAYSPPPQPGIHAYRQPTTHLPQAPRLPPQYGGQMPYAQLQATPQFPQQHQLPFNLGSAAPHQSYPAQYQALQNLGLPGQGLQALGNPVAAHTSLGSAAYGEHHQRPLGNQQSFPQNFASQDLATQLHLQRLQAQQRSYAQPQQQNVDLNKLFAPRAFGHAPAPATPAAPNMQLSLQELEAMMARQ